MKRLDGIAVLCGGSAEIYNIMCVSTQPFLLLCGATLALNVGKENDADGQVSEPIKLWTLCESL